MAYANAWDETYPPSSLPANQIHLGIQYWAIAIRERLNDVFGTTDWATSAQPFQPVQINFRGATPAIRGGSASLRFRNNADTFDNVTFADAGDVTARRNIIATNNLVSNQNLVFNAASAKILPGVTNLLFRNFADTLTNLTISDIGQATFRDSVTALSFATSSAVGKFVPGATSFSFRNAGDTLDNLLIANNGDVTIAGILDFASINNTKPVTLGGVTTVKKLGQVKNSQGPTSGALTVDFSTGNIQLVLLNGNCTLAFINAVPETLYVLRIKQDATGGRTVTGWPANIFPNPPIIGTTAVNTSCTLGIYYDGTNFLVMINSTFNV